MSNAPKSKQIADQINKQSAGANVGWVKTPIGLGTEQLHFVFGTSANGNALEVEKHICWPASVKAWVDEAEEALPGLLLHVGGEKCSASPPAAAPGRRAAAATLPDGPRHEQVFKRC